VKYGDLIEFDPIRTVKNLRQTDVSEDVRTFVISDRMASSLSDLIIPHLQFSEPHDNKGLLAVGNYGTGKTHLMSVIGAIAADAELLPLLTNADVVDDFAKIAGRFKVIRTSIGSTEMTLRDLIVAELEKGLQEIGVDYTFPPPTQVSNITDSLVEMMAAFESAHEGKGLLLIVDELLDFLRGRAETPLLKDLAFLREIGEVCAHTRFRFLAGVQEAIFDAPRFQFAADTMRRVKSRFEQVRIARSDVAFVVKERLLRKDVAQRDQIRKHLEQFAPLYEGMVARMDEFVSLFPVHPAYLEVFEQLTVVEKREVLKTLSDEMTALLDQDVPEDKPGVFSYDSLREVLAADPSNRQIRDVADVLDKTEKLRASVRHSLEPRDYEPTVMRIIDALAVHRLTTEDIKQPIGLTRRALCDELCLLPDDLPELDAHFLELSVDSAIAAMQKAVNGQYVSENETNHQLYIDVMKDVDYPQLIDQRADSLDPRALDAAYYDALGQLMEVQDKPMKAAYRIWQYELPWDAKNVTRLGYLFMGAPNERSTAKPPRDFYIYFLQPYDPVKFIDEEKADELFLRLEGQDDVFTTALRRYAAAADLQQQASTDRDVYVDHAQKSLRAMVTWLRENMGQAVTVTYRGKSQPLATWLGPAADRSSVRDMVETVASNALTDHFADRYPGYPKFEQALTQANVGDAAKQAIAHVLGASKTTSGTKTLASLKLLDDDGELTDRGEFAQRMIEQVTAGDGKAVNRGEVLDVRDDLYVWQPWNLEPIWVVVVAAALAQLGRVEIGYTGEGQIDAMTLDRLRTKNVEELQEFSHLAPPKALPVVALKEVAKLLGLAAGIIDTQGVKNDGVVEQLVAAATNTAERVVRANAAVGDRNTFWGSLLIEHPDEREQRLGQLQRVLDNVKARTTVGRMNKLDLTSAEIAAAQEAKEDLDYVEAVLAARDSLATLVNYLDKATGHFGADHELSADANAMRDEALTVLHAPEIDTGKVANIRRDAEELRNRFADEAARAHSRDRLDRVGDERKRKVLEGTTLKQLRALAGITLLPKETLAARLFELTEIESCPDFDEELLKKDIVCERCGYQPRPGAGRSANQALSDLEGALDKLLAEWVPALVESLREDAIRERIDLLDKSEQKNVKPFVENGELPQPVDAQFVAIVNRLVDGFDVRRVSKQQLWVALFPEASPTTLDGLRTRFDKFLVSLDGAGKADSIRVVPIGDEEQA
jgi:hypothetical protein